MLRLDCLNRARTIPGFMGGVQPEVLYDLFNPYNNEQTVGVEVGCLHGKSSYILANAINKGKLYCIDMWPGNILNKTSTAQTLEVFLKNTKECNNIIPIKGLSPEVIKDWTTPIDFVFIDASHTNPSDRDNIDFFLPLIKKGGIIAGHDYRANLKTIELNWEDVIINVNYLEDKLKQKVMNPSNTSIWYFKLD